ncbi:hypothetical protein B0H13DRAFT_2365629 [Mycena leptocephala]|nr:hypothetical protein B0H13DRAFT_2365629 [Mycena leptocephala]
MQGLDVVCFGGLKINYGHEKDEFEGRTGQEASGGNFLQIYAPAHRKTFTEQTIRTAFRKTGLIPFNRDAIDPSRLAPAKELSVTGAFPIRQPSPVQAVLDAWGKVQAGCDNVNSGTPHTSSSRMPLGPRENMMGSPLTPHANEMLNGLASTSASFLVPNDNPFTSTYQLPPPFFPTLPEQPTTWDAILRSPSGRRSKEDIENENHILRSAMRDQRKRNKQGEEIIETQNAQLVLQNMYAEKQRGALYHQEQRRKRGHAEALLQTEMGRIWTDKEFRDAVRQDDERVAKKQKTADVRAQKTQWKAKERKRIDEEHRRLRAKWEKKREHMKQQGKRGGWGHPPAKPKRRPTPDQFREDGDEMSVEGAQDQDDENIPSDESGEFSAEGSNLGLDFESDEGM